MIKSFQLVAVVSVLVSASALAAGAKAPAGAWSCSAKGTQLTRFGNQPRTFWSGYQETEEAARERAFRRCTREENMVVSSCAVTTCEQAE